MKIFANRLKALQESRGLSQVQISQLTGISQGTISGYLNDRKSPGLETAFHIAEALGVSVGWLCGEPEVPTLDWSNCAQVLTLLHELVDSFGFVVSVGNEGTKPVAYLCSANPLLCTFLRSVSEARRLFEEGLMNREMYDFVISGYIEKYGAAKPDNEEVL